MRFDPDKHHRRSIRLKGYDYSSPGAYFVTICTNNRECLFGRVEDGQVELTPIGKVADRFWHEITDHFEHVKNNEHVIMPNHLHGILMINEYCRGTACRAPTYEIFGKPRKGTIPTVIRSYKSAVTRWCRRNGYEYFQWQRNYYEHIIRTEDELKRIRNYIINNPLKWEEDRNNPKNWGI